MENDCGFLWGGSLFQKGKKMKIGSLITGDNVVTTFTLNYCPQFVGWIAGTGIKGLVVEVAGDGTICQLDEQGVASLEQAGRMGIVTNGALIPLANGLVSGKTTTIKITNSAAQTPDIFAFSLGRGDLYVQSLTQKALALSGTNLKDAFLMAFPNSGDSDRFTVTMQDELGRDTNQELNRVELQLFLATKSAVQNDANDYVFANDDREMRVMNFIPQADQNIYLQRFALIGPALDGSALQ